MARFISMLLITLGSVHQDVSSARACTCPASIEVHWPPAGEMLNVNSGIIVSHQAPEPLFLRDASGADVAFTTVDFPRLSDCRPNRFIVRPDAPLTDGETYTVGLVGDTIVPDVTFTASASAGGDRAPSGIDVHYTRVAHAELYHTECYLEALGEGHSLTALLRIDPVGAGATLVASATTSHPEWSEVKHTAVGDSELDLVVPLKTADDCITVTLFDAQGVAGATTTLCEPDDCATGGGSDPDNGFLPSLVGPAGPCIASPEPGPEAQPEPAPDADVPTPDSEDDGCASADDSRVGVTLFLILGMALLARRRRTAY